MILKLPNNICLVYINFIKTNKYTYRARCYPFTSVNIHISYKVAGDRSTTIICWWLPAKFDMLGTDFIGYKTSWFQWYIEYVYVCTRFKRSCFASQFYRISSCIAVSIRLKSDDIFKYGHINYPLYILILFMLYTYLRNIQDGVTFSVNGVFGV